MLYFFLNKFNFRNFLDFCVRPVKIMIQILVKKKHSFLTERYILNILPKMFLKHCCVLTRNKIFLLACKPKQKNASTTILL